MIICKQKVINKKQIIFQFKQSQLQVLFQENQVTEDVNIGRGRL